MYLSPSAFHKSKIRRPTSFHKLDFSFFFFKTNIGMHNAHNLIDPNVKLLLWNAAKRNKMIAWNRRGLCKTLPPRGV